MPEIFFAPSSLGHYYYEPIKLLKENNFTHKENLTGCKIFLDENVKLAHNAEGIITGTETYSEDVINKRPKLNDISRLGVGLDNIDLKTASIRGKPWSWLDW